MIGFLLFFDDDDDADDVVIVVVAGSLFHFEFTFVFHFVRSLAIAFEFGIASCY